MRTTNDGNIVNRWRDLDELLSRSISPCNVPDSNRSSMSNAVMANDQTKLISLTEAVTLARRGWKGGAAEIHRLQTHIADRFDGSVPELEPHYDVVGEYFDIGEVMAGNPECWATLSDNGLRMDARVPSIIRIVCNIAASGAVSHETFLKRGAAVIVLVDTLERHMIRCQVDVTSCVANGLNGQTYENIVTVKQDNEAVSMDKLAMLLGHSATLRRIMFSVREHEPDAIRRRFGLGKDMGNYGIPAESQDQGQLYMGAMRTQTDWSDDVVIAWLTKTLKTQGINVERRN